MKVSVIISNYNYARYLSRAINSVLSQTYSDIELVIVDDGSSDDSRDVITQIQAQAPDKIKAIFQANQGQGGAFNAGFEAASGEIIAFLDADDVWQPHKIQRIVEVFNTSDVVGVMHHLEIIDGDDNTINNASTQGAKLSEDLASVILNTGNAWCFPPTSGLAYRREALQKVFPIDPVKWRIWADGCIIYCTAFLGKIKTLHENLGSYRIHGANNHITKGAVTNEQEAKSQVGIEMTNQYINDFLVRISYPGRVDLSRNLQYRRTKYYQQSKWDSNEVWSISRLILGWPFYTGQERVYYLARFLFKSAKFLARPTVHTESTTI
ncbi:glycosyltransferase family 2 protein [Anabaena sp. UHCC 0399]|uniref:glycosyltransferase family 2 protein n=1 Tax=Anabaena sp. UHCC 0399 TaxID=3110238 RepID=UPI002B1F0E6F|nr:glycosyltransferase [Anabaena sp. UHCC 0399]MEA5568527.1 glycosyltransferase [Anabaena sp. UHCC 0399]